MHQGSPEPQAEFDTGNVDEFVQRGHSYLVGSYEAMWTAVARLVADIRAGAPDRDLNGTSPGCPHVH